MQLPNFKRFLFSSPPLPFLLLHKPHYRPHSSPPKPSTPFPYQSLSLSSPGMENPLPAAQLSSSSSSSTTSVSTSNSKALLVLCGKSSLEIEFAKSLQNNNNNTLKFPSEYDEGGVSVFVHPLEVDSSKPYDEEEKTFDIESYMNALTTDRFGRFLIWSPRLTSTQDLISKNFSVLPIGAFCVADIQFKGRGRSKNVWESPLGCLLFSFTSQMDDGRIVPLLQYVVSLAVVEGVKDICDAKGFPYIDIKIKWPNDLYLNGLKIGGILCTSTYSSKKFNVTTGIGLNLDNEKPTTCLNEALRQLTSVDYQLTREEVLAAFFKRFENFFGVLTNQGFKPLEESYYKAWLHSGQRVVIQEKREGQLSEDVVTIQGLTSSGYLLAMGEDCQFYELHPDGNSFDFFNGLIRRKLAE